MNKKIISFLFLGAFAFLAFMPSSRVLAQDTNLSIEAFQKQVNSLLEMIKNLQAQIDALRNQQVPFTPPNPIPSPDQGWDSLVGVLQAQGADGTTSIYMWGSHKITTDDGKSWLVKAVNDDVLEQLKKYEGQKVTLWGQLQYQNVEGGFTGFIAKKVYAEGYGCILSPRKLGSKGDDVKIVQQYLATDKQVYPEGLVTGYYGQLTKKAVTRFQEKNGLTATGELDDSTRTKIEGVVAPTLIGGGSSEQVYPCPTPKPVPIPNQGIKVYSPSAGENWQLGQTYKIAWNQIWPTAINDKKYGCTNPTPGQPGVPVCVDPAPGAPANVIEGSGFAPIGPVKIALHKYISCLYAGPVRCMMAEPMPYVITEKTDNNGYFTWTIPADLANQYQGQVIITIEASGSGFSGNSGVFTIGPGATTENKPPVVTGISGPTTLKVGETGTWTVKAYDPENGSLSYSVVWGDENPTALGGSTAPSLLQRQIQNSATFTHSYSTAGNYTPVFYVTDDHNQTAKTSMSVAVDSVLVKPVLEVSGYGGLCNYGGCSTHVTVNSDGSFVRSDGGRISKTGFIKLGLITKLNELMAATDFGAIRSVKFTGLCPTAIDGSELQYSFYLSGRVETMASCTTLIDNNSVLFKLVGDILNKTY